jgi:predicted O-linked N-acetylglucosamine transferase (SPINDLY family)
VNLAGLLGSQGRSAEAIQVYDEVERQIDKESVDLVLGSMAEAKDSVSVARKRKSVEALLEPEMEENAVSMAAVGLLMGAGDLVKLAKLVEIEELRYHKWANADGTTDANTISIATTKYGLSAPRTSETDAGESLFCPEKRRDMFFTKGNLKSAMGDIFDSRWEYIKGLISVGLGRMLLVYVQMGMPLLSEVNEVRAEIGGLIEDMAVAVSVIPPTLTTPSAALTIWHEIQKGAITKIDWKALWSGHGTMNANSIFLKTARPYDAAFHPSTASALQTLAKLAQDSEQISLAISLYYLSLMVYPTANVCNNLGILLAAHRPQETIEWYELGLHIDPAHVHIYTNLGSALKDSGQIQEGIACYEHAIALQPDFHIALANLANVLKDLGMVEEAILFYRRALVSKPDFVEAFCNYVNSLLFVCDWSNREENLEKIKGIVEIQLMEGNNGGLVVPGTLESGLTDRQQKSDVVSNYPSHYKSLQPFSKATIQPPKALPTVLPFHTFTYPSLTSFLIREISRRNAFRIHHNVLISSWFPELPSRPIALLNSSTPPTQEALQKSAHFPYPYAPPAPPRPYIKVGYLSSDFNNHPLSHLMQSVFGFHDRSQFRVFAYALTPSDGSAYRTKIETESDVFVDLSQFSNEAIVERIRADGIHVLCNLNGYTKGSRGEVFAARVAPVQMAFMGFAGTLGAGFVDDPEMGAGVSKAEAPGPVLDEMVYGDWGSESDGKMVAATKDLKWLVEGAHGRWIDYMVADEVACPRRLVCGEVLERDESEEAVEFEKQFGRKWEHEGRGEVVKADDRNRMYTERLIYMPHTFFVNDHRQGFRERVDHVVDALVDKVTKNGTCKSALEVIFEDEEKSLTTEELFEWRKEQIRRIKMRTEMFPWLREDTVIFANFNQLYKVFERICGAASFYLKV